ncbi:MAG TPA: hypothetical protein VD788_05190, partial [Candidatus Polarisedimenticolaceae bacterium]|nr:hypothetical protein [Candidatus Polarisedimenticolaceae bacterium]
VGIDLTLPSTPTNWLQGGAIVINGVPFPCSTRCGTNNPGYALAGLNLAPGAVRTISIPVLVPVGASGLGDVTIHMWNNQGGGGFGGAFETAFQKAATINVGAVRTAKPTLDCPIPSSAVQISGTSEPDAAIKAKFSLIDRGTGTADGVGDWVVNNFGAFGGLYGGLEVRVTATAPGKLESVLSDECFVTQTRECSDTVDNDGDGLTDFPADPGCTGPTDNSELDEIPECSDTLDNDSDGPIDFPADLGCFAAGDPVEDLNPACSDGIDNDGDGLIDFSGPMPDPDCANANDIDELTRPQCQDGVDNDGDGDIDFPDDVFCNSAFDDDEFDISVPSDIKARLLIVFDTSGSMNFNTCDATFTGGDGSTECPGFDVSCSTCPATDCNNGLPDDSRMAKVKAGLNNVIAGFGEVEYGLMRFHQRGESFQIPEDCPSQNASLQSGGWQGGGAEPCGGGFNAGDLLVSFSFDNQSDLLAWMDGDSNYPGEPPPNLDWELRGSGTTPIAGSLASALTYLEAVEDDDPASGCRPYEVILVTDGAETCGGDPDAAAAALLTAGFPVNVIGFATSDPTIVAGLDSIANAGGTGSAIIASDSTALSAAIADIIDDTILVEHCNSIDDDCDVLVDEDFPTLGDTCDNGELGVCFQTGPVVCRTIADDGDDLGVKCDAPGGMPSTEICDGLDNNCNGLVDEGFPVGCGCVPTPEVCNG